MRFLRATGTVLLVIGATLGFFVFYELVGTNIDTNRHQATLSRAFATEIKTSPAVAYPKAKLGEAVAHIRIPKIAVDRIVVEGTGTPQLLLGPGHYVGTAMPGQPGVVGIAGHRTTHGAPFYNLSALTIGDLITVETRAGVFRYHVTGKTVVNPSAGWVLHGDPKSKAKFRLVLTTCTPRFSAAHRLVVWADQEASPEIGKP